MDNYHQSLDTVFQALADPTRRAVLERLGRGPASVSDLAGPHRMALPSFMKHVRLLEETGLIRTSKLGRVRTCALRKDRLLAVENWLDAQRRIWEARTDRLEEFVTRTED
jgi:DNA-binding transcriptional ArsR family regulator